MAVFVSALGQGFTGPAFQPQADLNGDGTVDDGDIEAFLEAVRAAPATQSDYSLDQ